MEWIEAMMRGEGDDVGNDSELNEPDGKQVIEGSSDSTYG
jgi:hypothetical protein